LVHRVGLHDKLMTVATSADGPGRPARLHTSSKVIEVDPVAGTIELENGNIVTADVIVGADGIYVGFSTQSTVSLTLLRG
jgi:2-polyprenyl-6-methoxyphenol hydroxylase-like FAD-dependent oxidoreductase